MWFSILDSHEFLTQIDANAGQNLTRNGNRHSKLGGRCASPLVCSLSNFFICMCTLNCLEIETFHPFFSIYIWSVDRRAYCWNIWFHINICINNRSAYLFIRSHIPVSWAFKENVIKIPSKHMCSAETKQIKRQTYVDRYRHWYGRE